MVIRGRSPYAVEKKAIAQKERWEVAWRKQKAADLTAAAQSVVRELQQLLEGTLAHHDAVDWNSLKSRRRFPKEKPVVPKSEVQPPAEPPALAVPPVPRMSDRKYEAALSIVDYLVPSRRRRKEEAAAAQFAQDHAAWLKERSACEQRAVEEKQRYKEAVRLWGAAVERADLEWQAAQKRAEQEWEAERAGFMRGQAEENAEVDVWKEDYARGCPQAVSRYMDLVLSRSCYPECLPKRHHRIEYAADTRVLVVDYTLPLPEDLPRTREVKYIQSRDAFEEAPLSAAVLNALYDSVVYQIALRTLHEVFESDTAGVVDYVVFNGWTNSIDKGTGKEFNACIVSLQAKRDEFIAIDLARVEPKACFKQLKGVGSAKLHGLTPVAPVAQMSTHDKRFVSSYEVTSRLDEGVNLAALPWEDFEHLIREVFEKEFAQDGGQVKVTQASRDGGVDAVAFDPDPIRGGKIVIQAKRYTNTVGVSAVRDLYGTVMNEGATKGILVTTADYGPDAYEFARGKPLTLLNGSHLLHLLEKHGQKARIDLREAKQMLSEQD